MEISPLILPGVVTLVFGYTIAWSIWVSKKLTEFQVAAASTLTRAEHADICTKKDEELNRRLDKLEKLFEDQFEHVTNTLEKQDNVAKEFRHSLNNSLHIMQTNLEVLKNKQEIAAIISANQPPPSRRR